MKLSGKITVLCLALFFFARNGAIYADGMYFRDVRDAVDSRHHSRLMETGNVTIIHDEGKDDLVLVPDSEYREKILKNRVEKNEKNFPFVYESLYYIPKAELLKSGKSGNSKIDINDISRVLRSVSAMQGMTYHSSTKKKDLVLYERAYMVESKNSNVRIEDKNVGNADGLEAFCLQDDNSFGLNHYRLNYHQNGNSMLAFFTLTDVMGLGPVKAVYPEKLKISIYAEDFEEGILLYLCTDLESKRFPGIKSQIEDSMSSRMEAIYRWFFLQF